MTMRRYAVILPVLIVLLAAAIFIAANGQQGAAAAEKAATPTATATPQSGQDSTDNWGATDGSSDSSDSGDSNDSSSDSWDSEDDSADPEDGIGEDGTSNGGAVDLGVGDTENVAVANRLESVKVLEDNVDDDEEEFVRFCFRDEIQDLDENESASFAVIGPDPATGETATDVTLDDAREKCVIAGFDSDSDVKSYTLGAVEGGVVKNRDDEKNIADSQTLTGGHTTSGDGRTSGPDLVGVKVSKSLNRVKYYFDEDLKDDSSADASSFGFYTERGNARTGNDTVSVDDRVVTIEFADDDQVDNARRGFVAAGAVQDTNGTDNPVGEMGGRTSNPDLTDVKRSSADTEYDFTFDDNISQDIDASEFVLVTDNGEEIEGEDADVDGRKVHVSFSRDIEKYDTDSIVLAVVNPDADSAGSDDSDTSSDSSDEDGDEITLGVDKLRSNSTRKGRTTGPDLVSISTDSNDRRMTLTFDEDVDDEDSSYDSSGIYIATDDDELVQADRILEIEDKKVYVKADENLLDSLVGVTLEQDSIEDWEGNGNPIGTVAHGSADKLGTTKSLYGHSYGKTKND